MFFQRCFVVVKCFSVLFGYCLKEMSNRLTTSHHQIRANLLKKTRKCLEGPLDGEHFVVAQADFC